MPKDGSNIGRLLVSQQGREVICQAHRSYRKAGCTVVTACTHACTPQVPFLSFDVLAPPRTHLHSLA